MKHFNPMLGRIHSVLVSMVTILSLLLLQACGGKVADLSAGQASASGVKIVSKTLPGMTVGVVQTGISTAGGVLPLTFSISDGQLPSGLIMDPLTGQISGTIPPAAANQTYTPTIKVTDAAGLSDLRVFNCKVDPGNALLSIVSTEMSAVTAGVPYSFPVAVVGGTTPYKFAISTGLLPAGLLLDETTGVISGTAAISSGGQSYVVVVKVSDSASQIQTISFVGQVSANPVGAIQIVSTSIPGVGVGAVSTGISTAGGATPLHFTVSSGTLPSGLSIDPMTGSISGTVPVSAANSSYGFSVTVTDSSGSAATRSFTGTINPGSSVLTLITTSLSTIAAGISYNFPLSATGGTAPYAFSVASGALPTGLSLDSATGIISGTPGITTGGRSYSVTIRVTDASAQSQTNSFVGTVASNPVGSIQIVSTTVPGMAVGAVSTGISTSGGVAPLVFSVSSGTLPAGLSINTTTGAITGTIPVSAGNANYGFSIAVADAAGATASKSFSGTINPGSALLSMITTAISPVTAGITYSFPIAVSGGSKPYAFAVTSGTLPSGLSLGASTGIISGSPAITSGGQAYSFTIRVTDAASQTQTVSLVGTVAANPVGGVQIVSTTIPGIAVGAVSTGVSTSGGVTPLTFAVSSGALPSGLSINTTTGAITGTVPISQGNTNYGFSVTVVDSAGISSSKSFTGTVNAGSSVLSILSTQLSPVTAGVAYSFPLTVSGGTTPYGFTIITGSLPAGLAIHPTTGVLSGTPAVTSGGQAYSFTVRASDSGSQTVTQQFIGTIANNPVGSVKVVSTTIPGLGVGPVSTGISTAGGITPLTFALTSGTLPTGLALNASTGAITGTIPVSSANASYGFSITVTDASSAFDVKSFTGTINAGTSLLTINSTSLSQFIAGISYSYPIVVTGGSSPYTFTISSGSLPTGVSLNPSSGTLSGTPSVTTAGQSFAFTVTTTDASNQTANKTYTATVASSTAASLSIASQTIPAPSAGSPYVAAISVSGGTPPYAYSISNGSLPSGLSLSTSSGVISGTPAYSTKGSAYLFTVQVTDTTNLTTSGSYPGFVGSYTTAISPSTLPTAIPSANYNGFISTTGGQAPYIYSLTSGTLPSGLALNASTGVISGTVAESEAGLTRNFTIKSVDANNVQTSTAYALTTDNFTVNITNSSLANATEGSAYSNSSTSLTATGGSGPYTFQYTGSLPSGIGLTSSGAFFGTAATNSGAMSPGTNYTIYVRARDSNNNVSATVPLILTTIVSVPSVTSATPTAAVLGSAYSYTLTASGGRGPYSFAVTAGSAPAGLSLATSGLMSGIASVANTCPTGSFTVRVTDSLSQISGASVKCIDTVNGVLILNTSLPMVAIGVNYAAQINVSGGTTPYTYAATGLPNGVTIHPTTGALAGFTNSTSGDYSAYITVTDSSTPSALSTTRAFTVSVRNLLTLASSTIARAATGVAYNNGSGVQLNANGGYSPYTYALSSGSLPSGMTLTSAGKIQGTPAYNTAVNGGTYSFSVIATDSLGNQTAAAAYTLYVTIPPKLTDSSLPMAVVGTPYAYDIRRTGGVNQFNGSSTATRLTYSVSVTSPAATTLSGIGLNYSNSTGRIYGTPNAAGTYTLAVSLTDQHGFVASKNMPLKVNSVGKRLDLKTARWSDPCTGQSQCYPQAYDIAPITGNSQQFVVHSRADTAPRSLQIVKIDAEGRIPLAGANVTSINVPLSIASDINYVRIADIDQDAKLDIVFVDRVSKQVCVLWNSGTVDTFGMPNGFSTNSSTCFPMPNGANAANYPYYLQVRSDLRPDSVNNGRQDLIVSGTSTADSMIYAMLNTCAVNGNCSSASQRAAIFKGYVTTTGNITSGGSSMTSVPSVTGLWVGAVIYGVGIPVNTTITGISGSGPYTLTLSANATATTTAVSITQQAVTTITGNVTVNTNTILGVASLGSPQIFAGQQVSGTGIQAGTTVASITGSAGNYTITMNYNFVSPGVTGSSSLQFYGPAAARPILYSSGSRAMRDVTNMGVGWFKAAKPTLGAANSSDTCPGIVILGMDQGGSNSAFGYLARQTYSGGQCLGDFQIHSTASSNNQDELLVGQTWPGGLAVSDFNNDGYSDAAFAMGTANTNSANIRVYITPTSGNGFVGGTASTAQLQSRGTTTTAAAKLIPYCIDGSSSCSYPALVATCGREYWMPAINGGGYQYQQSCLAVLPNQCSAATCTTPFEASTPSLRIDYPAPAGANQELMQVPLVSTSFVYPTATTVAGSPTMTVSSTTNIAVGQSVSGTNIANYAYVTAVNTGASTITINQNALGSSAANGVTLTIPVVPTRRDIVFTGHDHYTGNPYFIVYARNGSSSLDPLKGAAMLDAFPTSFLMPADIGATKFGDANGDNVMDMFAFSPSQSFVGSYVSNSSGATTLSIATNPSPAYLSNPSMGGCPADASGCFPDPYFNSMGVQQGYPNTYPNQNIMDVGDLNNDGIPDLVVVGYSSRGVAITLGGSNGDFATPALYELGVGQDIKPKAVAIADLDQDGIADVVIVGINSTSGLSPVAAWLKGNGDGSFVSAERIDNILNGCTDPRSIQAIDIDQDGRPELATLCYTTQAVWISRRNADANWVLQTGSTINQSGGANGTAMKFARLTTSTATGMDVAIGGLDLNNSMRILNNVTLTVTNASTGAFSLSVGTVGSYIALNGYVGDLDVGDVNADGYGDVVVSMTRQTLTGNVGQSFYTCTSSAAGVCKPALWGGEGADPTSISVVDINNDNIPEIFASFKTDRLIFRTISRILNLSQ
ncbi:MAG: putative Ig domain-containing protein [Pseudomonadota bacterium]